MLVEVRFSEVGGDSTVDGGAVTAGVSPGEVFGSPPPTATATAIIATASPATVARARLRRRAKWSAQGCRARWPSEAAGAGTSGATAVGAAKTVGASVTPAGDGPAPALSAADIAAALAKRSSGFLAMARSTVRSEE